MDPNSLRFGWALVFGIGTGSAIWYLTLVVRERLGLIGTPDAVLRVQSNALVIDAVFITLSALCWLGAALVDYRDQTKVFVLPLIIG